MAESETDRDADTVTSVELVSVGGRVTVVRVVETFCVSLADAVREALSEDDVDWELV